ncbi:hypothetical protein [Siansivirga zeaxanthinifaciens]|uniref:Sugar-binding protein n=1 Tax=Siansivirga zeaxanthinifaciens CC-SAMT-1 TaxID=1454006 RepID=A0A0C5W0H5_9FLAO|nr:hypothetical protein [Siansivirga zeaxanthinifaciens]AJR04756.1 hypothetical protein AW14_03145 [Siansivirga zeaxanthinifaciens CC-SAMT-1]
MKQIKIFAGVVFASVLISCNDTKAKQLQISDNAPMNPVVAFLHREDLALKGPVKMAGDDYFDLNGYITESMGDIYTHSDSKSTMKTGKTLYTYTKNKKGQFEKLTISGNNEPTYFTYHSNGLLASEYGIENGISYKTTYTYDAKGRIKQCAYTYGDDPVKISYYTYKNINNDTLEIEIRFNNSKAKEIYRYKNGIMVASTLSGETTTYSYIFDARGNWLSQTTSYGSSTTRAITYY